MNVLGVDPGAGGGLAILNSKTLMLVRGRRMPIYKIRGKSLVSSDGILQFVEGVEIDAAIVEQVNAFGMGSRTSAFSFGRSTGAAEVMANMVSDRIEWVSPATWKKHFKLSSNKQESIDAARAMFGEINFPWTAKADDGIAEAALMARWFIDKRA